MPGEGRGGEGGGEGHGRGGVPNGGNGFGGKDNEGLIVVRMLFYIIPLFIFVLAHGPFLFSLHIPSLLSSNNNNIDIQDAMMPPHVEGSEAKAGRMGDGAFDAVARGGLDTQDAALTVSYTTLIF